MRQPTTSKQSGFALILSLLALVLLTTMGLALSNSTGVELQIATNHRWSASARYNAEAGIDFGRSMLMTLDEAGWAAILPAARAANPWLPGAWDGATESASGVTPKFTRAIRNFENWQCDERGYGMGYGVVYDDGSGTEAQEFRSEIGGATLNGSFTLWIRRPVMWAGGSGTGDTLKDYEGNDVVILVSEGVAPYTGATANLGTFAATNRSVYTIEVLVNRVNTTTSESTECKNRQGQSGGAASGGNSSGCVALTETRQVKEALGAAATGTGAVLVP